MSEATYTVQDIIEVERNAYDRGLAKALAVLNGPELRTQLMNAGLTYPSAALRTATDMIKATK